MFKRMDKILLHRMGKGLSVLLVFCGAIFLIRAVEPSEGAYTRFVDIYLRQYGLFGMLYFVLFAGVLAAIGIPRQLISFVAGYAFGAWYGLIVSTLASTFGCFMTFSYARFLLQDFIQKRFSKRLKPLERFLHKSPFGTAFILRIFPSGNNMLFSALAGTTTVKLLPFVLGSLVGYIPQNVIFSLLGSGLDIDPTWRILFAILFFVVAVFMAYWLYKRYRLESIYATNEEENEITDMALSVEQGK